MGTENGRGRGRGPIAVLFEISEMFYKTFGTATTPPSWLTWLNGCHIIAVKWNSFSWQTTWTSKTPFPIFTFYHFSKGFPLPLPPAPAQPACNSLAQPISFFALVAVSSDKEIEMLRASVCVCAVYVCGTPYTSLLCVGVAQLINCGYKLIRVPNER